MNIKLNFNNNKLKFAGDKPNSSGGKDDSTKTNVNIKSGTTTNPPSPNVTYDSQIEQGPPKKAKLDTKV